MDCTDEANTQLLLQYDFTQYSPPEMVAYILDFLDYEDVASALAVNRQWYMLVSRLIADIICGEFWAEKVSEDHARINITVARDTEHTLLNYRLHHLSAFATLELRINYSGYAVIKDWPKHIAQLASLRNLINLELINHPYMHCRYNWRALSKLTNLQRLLVDCRHINCDWLPSGLHSLELRWATLSSDVVIKISRMALLSDLCLDYVVVEDQMSLNMSLLRLKSQLTSFMFRDRIAEETFTGRDKAEQLLQQGPTSWANFATLTALETLQLFSASVNSLELISNLTQLTSLALFNPHVDISFFRPLSYFTNLRSFTANTIDYTFTLLKWMTPLTNLAELSLTNCNKIFDSDLQGLTILPRLTRLVLGGTSKLTADCFGYLLMLTSLQQVKLGTPSFGKEATTNLPFSVCID